MKKLGLILMGALLLGCEPGKPKNVGSDFILPEEMSDCKIFYLDGAYKGLWVVRCTNSDTTTNWTEHCGKSCSRHVAVTVTEEGQ